VGAVLLALGVFVGHPFVVRQDRRRLDELRPLVGHVVTVTAGTRFVARTTGVLELDHHRRRVHLVQDDNTGFFGLPEPPRTISVHPGEIHRVEDTETAAVIRWV